MNYSEECKLVLRKSGNGSHGVERISIVSPKRAYGAIMLDRCGTRDNEYIEYLQLDTRVQL